MKMLLKSSLIVYVLISVGCSDKNSDSIIETSNVVTENYISSTSNPFITQESTVILSLEHSTSLLNDGDIGEIGSDCFTFTPSKDLNNTLIEIDNIAIAYITIKDIQTQLPIEIYKNSQDVYIDFKKNNNYEYCVFHDNEAEKSQPIFVMYSDQNSINTLKTTGSCTGNACNLNNADLTQMNLRDTNLSGAKMHGTILAGADLTNADLRNSKMSNVNLTNTILDNTVINYPYFSYTTLEGAKFRGTKFPDSFDFSTSPTNPQHSSTPYKNVDFTNANLSGTKMVGVNFREAHFSKTNLDGANVFNTDFSDTFFTEMNLSHVLHLGKGNSFSNSFLYGMDLNSLKNLNFSKIDVKDAHFKFFYVFDDDSINKINKNNLICSEFPKNESMSPKYFCIDKKYKELDMHLYEKSAYEDEKVNKEENCFDFFINRMQSFPFEGRLCFAKSSNIWIEWSDIKNEDFLVQEMKVNYKCKTNFALETDCKTPTYISFGFKK